MQQSNALIKCEKVCPIIAQSGDFESENNRFSCQLSNEREKRSRKQRKRFGGDLRLNFYILHNKENTLGHSKICVLCEIKFKSKTKRQSITINSS